MPSLALAGEGLRGERLQIDAVEFYESEHVCRVAYFAKYA
jgi:hypothetical protein